VPRKRRKIKFRLSVIKDSPCVSTCHEANSLCSSNGMNRKKGKERIRTIRRREGGFHCGRWQPDEHRRFIEAILKYGNEWKLVQKHVGTRSSTQARSHAQKFFVKVKRSNLFDFDVDFSKHSLKSLHDLATSLNSEDYINTIKTLNCVAFERKPLRRRPDDPANDSFINDIQSTILTNSMGLR
jgi:SHAQKYF class myb-like DNA-binding protein